MTNPENKNKDSFSSRIKTSLQQKENGAQNETLDKLRHISGSKVTDSTVIDTRSPKSTGRKSKPTSQEEFKCLDADRYEVIEEIGSGGFGRVYKGFDTKLSRQIAIKTVRFDKNTETIAFENEARTLAQCNHPNIVQVHDVLKSNDSSCIVMEFINGPNICEYAATLKESKQSKQWQRILCSHIVDLVDALCYMHKREIYHQDIKPKNILVSLSNSCAKLVDFGLAIDYFDQSKHSGLSGTYGYMPPEKFCGEGTPKMHDIYAFGAVFFEVFTGRVANPGETAREVAEHVVEGKIEFSDTESINEKLQKICLKCLEKDPEKRYQSFEEIYRDIMKYLGGNTAVNDYPYLSLIADKKKLVFPLTQSKNFIGRTFNNQIVIPDPSISRSQAVIEISETVKIKNLSEVNKIKVGNIELGYEQKMQLVGHETIKISDYIFHYIPRSEIQDTKEMVIEIEGKNSQVVNRVVTPISASQKEAQKIGLTYSQIDNSMWESTIATQERKESPISSLSTKDEKPLKSQDIQELQSSIDKLKKTIEQFEQKLSQQ
ncbi:FHA domain-containing serine/threonine-protein kinase [Candidatus Uabimicrobium amorphum]|uniref:Serine/threonine protein kinase n=1 Tax=Uabimicrobium amorphum TaxID=2596890 RepID=A0A5S9F463_UABAM|nr:FHA domain-containing serine/threonine-protein kinase [Candidatus Uabimicrobium amorphum]BBM85202.1 serine/threonine protein kinase [Candidatus Uabimicrobium amorphum]